MVNCVPTFARGLKHAYLVGLVLVMIPGCGADVAVMEPPEATPAEMMGVASMADMPRSTPISRLFLPDGEEPDERRLRAERQDRAGRVADEIADCMASLGFEYQSDPVGTVDRFSAPKAGELAPHSDQWVAAYGFGITTLHFQRSQVGPDLLGRDDDGADEARTDAGARFAYYETLGESGVAAYEEALNGSTSTPGCRREAEQVIPPVDDGGIADTETAFASIFEDELRDLHRRTEADPRIAEHEDGVRTCVGGQGYDFTGRLDLYNRWSSELAQLSTPLWGEDGPSVDIDSLPLVQQDAFLSGLPAPPLTAASRRRLAELQAEEIEMAVVVVECGGGLLNEMVVRHEILAEYEREFLVEHEDAVARFTDEQGR